MPNVSSILKQLKQERDRVAKQLSGMDAALRAFAGVYGNGQPSRKRAEDVSKESGQDSCCTACKVVEGQEV
jgi:hypothetical protein